MKKTCLFLTLLFLSFHTILSAQAEKTHTRISIITCAPGDELYSIFGHTAIRIIDSSKKTDLVFGYGNFDFNEPDFYFKFVRGKLNYSLSAEDLPTFLYEYQVTHRSVTEQELLLNDSSKQVISEALAKNLMGNNRYYKYDFLYDNCTSRVKDILLKYAGMQVNKQLVPKGTSFRDMIHEYLDRGGMSWTKMGMDILLGSPSDKVVTVNESMFLPDYLLKGIDSSETTLLLKRQSILIAKKTGSTDHINWPVIVFAIVSAMILIISFLRRSWAQKITQASDSLLLLITGMIGCLLLFTWFGTDHTSFATNYNLLWALPTNIIAAFVIGKKTAWLQKYFLLSSILYGLLLVFWHWLPQQLHPAFIPITLVLFVRTANLAKA